jgi:dihydrolipoamide dehydrogenase
MTYDLTVIGSGPGGYVAAIKAAELGLKVACVEKEKVLGGTCLNVGCIPSKALLNSSEHFHYAQHGFEKHGISTGSVKINISKMMKRKEGVVKELNQGIEGLFKKNKIEWVSGSGSLVTGKNGTEVVVKSGNGKKKTLATRYTLLATGSTPIELPFLPFDGQNVISSTEALELTKIPKSLLVIGAGAIGLELGSVWSRLGTEVEVVEFLPQIAAGFDPDVSKALQKLFEAQGLKFHLSTEVKSAEVLKSKVKLAAMQEGKEKFFEAEKVLVAVGRKPFTDGLGLEEAGIEVTAKGTDIRGQKLANVSRWRLCHWRCHRRPHAGP